ncbi:MAG: hypothetical protein H7A25_03820 [Leptospiraceae bacterium]|nr:hypothetical protein [Leptospiraceae bacterium]
MNVSFPLYYLYTLSRPSPIYFVFLLLEALLLPAGLYALSSLKSKELKVPKEFSFSDRDIIYSVQFPIAIFASILFSSLALSCLMILLLLVFQKDTSAISIGLLFTFFSSILFVMSYFFYIRNSGYLILKEEKLFYWNRFRRIQISFQDIRIFKEGIYIFPALQIKDKQNQTIFINTRIQNFSKIYADLRSKYLDFNELAGEDSYLFPWEVKLPTGFYRKLYYSLSLFMLIPISLSIAISSFSAGLILFLTFGIITFFIYIVSLNPFQPYRIVFDKEKLLFQFFLRKDKIFLRDDFSKMTKKRTEYEGQMNDYLELQFQKEVIQIKDTRLLEFGYFIDRFLSRLHRLYN